MAPPQSTSSQPGSAEIRISPAWGACSAAHRRDSPSGYWSHSKLVALDGRREGRRVAVEIPADPAPVGGLAPRPKPQLRAGALDHHGAAARRRAVGIAAAHRRGVALEPGEEVDAVEVAQPVADAGVDPSKRRSSHNTYTAAARELGQTASSASRGSVWLGCSTRHREPRSSASGSGSVTWVWA